MPKQAETNAAHSNGGGGITVAVDDRIPYIRGVFEPFADVCYLDPSEMTTEAVQNVDALVVRTRTRCDAALLRGSRVQHIATATIGFDHIDMEYCTSNGITVSTSAGCNARAVAQWVFAALRELSAGAGVRGKTLGVVGVGNVGAEVCQMAEHEGLNVLRNDPPRAEREGAEGFVELDYLLRNSDIVTMHVPLTLATRGMANDCFFNTLQRGAWFLNSSRGEVVDEEALTQARNEGRVVCVALDVWQNEPQINRDLLILSNIATPHIAGYSARGKARATQMAIRSIAEKFDITTLKNWVPDFPLNLEQPSQYNILADDEALHSDPAGFEKLRNTYNYR